MANIPKVDGNFDLEVNNATQSYEDILYTDNKVISGDIHIHITAKSGVLNNTPTTGITYTEDTSQQSVLPSEGALYLNEGYYQNTKITLDHMLPDPSGTYTNPGTNDIRAGRKAYDGSGKLIVGTMADVTPSFSGGTPSLTNTTNTITTNMATASSGTYKINAVAKAKATRTKVSYNNDYTGYLDKASGTEASAAVTSAEDSINAVTIYIKDASPSAEVSSLSVPSVEVSGAVTGMATASSGNYYIQINATKTDGSVKAKYKNTQEGYAPANAGSESGASAIIPSVDGSGTKIYIKECTIGNTTTTQPSTTTYPVAITLTPTPASTYYFTLGAGYNPNRQIKVQPMSAGTAASPTSEVSSLNAPTVSITASVNGMAIANSGNYYIELDATKQNGSVKSKYKNSRAGYAAQNTTGTESSSATTITPNITGSGTKIYIQEAVVDTSALSEHPTILAWGNQVGVMPGYVGSTLYFQAQPVSFESQVFATPTTIGYSIFASDYNKDGIVEVEVLPYALVAKTATPTTTQDIVVAPADADGLSQVTVKSITVGSATLPNTTITNEVSSITVERDTNTPTIYKVSGSYVATVTITPTVTPGWIDSINNGEIRINTEVNATLPRGRCNNYTTTQPSGYSIRNAIADTVVRFYPVDNTPGYIGVNDYVRVSAITIGSFNTPSTTTTLTTSITAVQPSSSDTYIDYNVGYTTSGYIKINKVDAGRVSASASWIEDVLVTPGTYSYLSAVTINQMKVSSATTGYYKSNGSEIASLFTGSDNSISFTPYSGCHLPLRKIFIWKNHSSSSPYYVSLNYALGKKVLLFTSWAGDTYISIRSNSGTTDLGSKKNIYSSSSANQFRVEYYYLKVYTSASSYYSEYHIKAEGSSNGSTWTSLYESYQRDTPYRIAIFPYSGTNSTPYVTLMFGSDDN